MQHIVQIAFDFDDARVTEKIENQASQQIIDKITKDIEQKMFASPGWGLEPDPKRDDLKNWVKDIIHEEFINYKDEIITKAVKELVDSTKRTKAFKEKLNTEMKEAN